MKLKRVTVTGADDAVDIQALVDLSAEFPFVEWGVLAAPKHVGVPRYPSLEWRTQFFWTGVPQALHLCGEFSRLALAGYDEWPGGLIYPRVQLNGFSAWKLPGLRFASMYEEYRGHSTEVILQVQDQQALAHAGKLAEQHPNVSALWDQSGGAGQLISFWPWHKNLRMGYAGGFTPANVVEVLKSLDHETEAEWVDMESGGRTEDRFDLVKVRSYLELTAPFVVKA